jgi:CheY-like chemotaxis protein
MPLISHRNKYCVLIDDDEDDLFVFGETVRKNFKDFNFIGYQDVKGFLNVLNEIDYQQISYIFLDLNMPKVNGLEALDELKRIKGVNRIPVVIYSTSNNPADINAALKKGARAFISKPSKITELITELSIYLEKEKV